MSNDVRRTSGDRPAIRDIEWIAFDAVGTLLYPDPPVVDVYAEIGRRHGSRRTRTEIAARFAEAFAANEAGDLRLEPTSPEALRTSEGREFERWRSIVTRVLSDADHPNECFAELFEHFGRPDAWACYPDVSETLTTLHQRGFGLALASNFDSRLERVWRGRQELRLISRIVISSRVGFRKPSARFFDALRQATGCHPERLLMVGDDWTNDVDGARRAGLQALQLNRKRHRAADDETFPPIVELQELLGRLVGPKET